jgi:hypothetical protein
LSVSALTSDSGAALWLRALWGLMGAFLVFDTVIS